MPYSVYLFASCMRVTQQIPRSLMTAQWTKGIIHLFSTYLWMTHVVVVGDFEVSKTKLLLSWE